MEADLAPPRARAPATHVGVFHMLATNPPPLVMWAHPSNFDLEDRDVTPHGIAETDPGDLSDVQRYLRQFYGFMRAQAARKARASIVDAALGAYIEAVFRETDASLVAYGDVEALAVGSLLAIGRALNEEIDSSMVFVEATIDTDVMSKDTEWLIVARHLLFAVHELTLLNWGEISTNWTDERVGSLNLKYRPTSTRGPRVTQGDDRVATATEIAGRMRDRSEKLAEAGRALGGDSEAFAREMRYVLSHHGGRMPEGVNRFDLIGYEEAVLRRASGEPVRFLRFPRGALPFASDDYDPRSDDVAFPMLIYPRIINVEAIDGDYESAKRAMNEIPADELFIAAPVRGSNRGDLESSRTFELLDEKDGYPLWILNKPPGRIDDDLLHARLFRVRGVTTAFLL